MAGVNARLQANGFGGRSSLWKHEAAALFAAWYPCPPDVRAGKHYTLGVSGVPIPEVVLETEPGFPAAVWEHYNRVLTPEERAMPEWHPSNPASADRYSAAFRQIHRDLLQRWDGPGAPPPYYTRNAAGRRAFWSVPGRTLDYVIGHINAGNNPPLRWPTPEEVAEHIEGPGMAPARRNARWAPRRTTVSSSRSSSSSSSHSSPVSRSAPMTLRTPKPEPGTGSSRRGSRGGFVYGQDGGLVLNNSGRPVRSASARQQPPVAKKVKVKTEAASSLAEELRRFHEQHGEGFDDVALSLAVEASKNDVLPMDEAAARKWSLNDHLAITGTPLFSVDDSDDDDGGFFPPPANQGESGPSNAGGVKEEDGDWEDWSAFDDYRRY